MNQRKDIGIMYEATIGVLKKTILFKGIAPENIARMIECFNPVFRKCARNEIIALAGTPYAGIGVLLEGEASVVKETSAGARIVLKIIKPGELFGEMIAFSDQSLWPATVQSTSDSAALFIPREKIIGECEKQCLWHRILVRNMLGILSNRALMLNRKLEYLSIKSMRGRIGSFLADQYKKTGSRTLILEMNRNELADFLNVSRPSMSRELGRMKDEGIIDYHLSTVRILDLDALSRAGDV